MQLGSSHEYSATATLGGVGVPVTLPSGSYTTVGLAVTWYARTRIVTSLGDRGAASVQSSIRQFVLAPVGVVALVADRVPVPVLVRSVLEPSVNDVFCTRGSPSDGMALRAEPLRADPLRADPLRADPLTRGFVGSEMWPTSAPSVQLKAEHSSSRSVMNEVSGFVTNTWNT